MTAVDQPMKMRSCGLQYRPRSSVSTSMGYVQMCQIVVVFLQDRLPRGARVPFATAMVAMPFSSACSAGCRLMSL